MSRHFRPWKIDQAQLLPPAIADYVPADHLAQFVVALAREHLDLSEIVASYKSGLGQPPFDPRMMTALLLYAYCPGLYSSRRIAKACAERVDFMMIVAHDAPDFRTIADFRKRRLQALGRLFLQVLKLAEKAGLAKLGHVALDGAKIKANASKHKAMSYERMKTRETELRAEVDRWLEAAQAAGAQEDKLHGASRRGDEMPGWIADKQERLAKIREVREALEAEAAAAAAAKAEAERAAEEKRKAENRKRSGPVPRPPSKEPDPRAQRNFTDPDSQEWLHPGLQRASGGRRGQANHRGAWTDAEHERLSATCSPGRRRPGQPRTQAEGGFGGRGLLQRGQSFGARDPEDQSLCRHRASQASGRDHAQGRRRDDADNAAEAEARRLSQPAPIAKQIVEPVFGQIKQARGFRQFLLRGLEAVKARAMLDFG
jgi:transposase